MAKKYHPRRSLQTKIHIAKNQRGMTDSEYRDLLLGATGKESTKGMTVKEMSAVLNRFIELGWKPKAKGHKAVQPSKDYYAIPDGTPHARQKRYIAALWNALEWKMSGLDTRCKSQFGVESFLWLNDQAALQTLGRDLVNRCLKKDIDPSPEGLGL
jgi:Protein of unknown function (DUF1018).